MSKIKGYRGVKCFVGSLILVMSGCVGITIAWADDRAAREDAIAKYTGTTRIEHSPKGSKTTSSTTVPGPSTSSVADREWMASRHPHLPPIYAGPLTVLAETGPSRGEPAKAADSVSKFRKRDTTVYASSQTSPGVVTATARATFTTALPAPPASQKTASLPMNPSESRGDEAVPIDVGAVRAENSELPELPELYVIVLAGDTGLNAHSQRVRPSKAWRHGRGHTWDWTTRKIAPLIDGHINFANIETVVTERNSLRPSSKAFNFRMHPNGARHLVDIGFNLFSLANNHSADYGARGVLDTLVHSEKLRSAGLRGFAGLGVDRDHAIRSDSFSIGRSRFGFAAMGIGARQPGPSRAGVGKPGQVNIYGSADFDAVLSDLVEAPVDYRILSMHFGAERNVRPLPGQVAKWRDEVQVGNGVDLVVGHHAHVAQGVQINNGKLIFYGLGNFLHLGMQDMAKFNACRDYGVLARVFVVRQPDGQMEAQAVQVVPLKDMHLQAKPRTGKSAALRLDVLNMLGEELDDDVVGSRGVRFAKQADGTGLFCRPGAGDGPGRLGVLCRNFAPAPALSKRQRARLRSMCRMPSTKVAKVKRKSGTTTPRRRVKVWRGTDVFSRE